NAHDRACVDTRSSNTIWLSASRTSMCGAQSETGLAECLLIDDPSRFDLAQKFFAQICASGHGDRGDSDWPVGVAQALAPTDFNIQQPSSITRVWCRAKGSRARRSRGWWPPG